MKKSNVLGLLAALVLPVGVVAEESEAPPPLTDVWIIVPKAGMAPQFEAAVAKHMAPATEADPRVRATAVRTLAALSGTRVLPLSGSGRTTSCSVVLATLPFGSRTAISTTWKAPKPPMAPLTRPLPSALSSTSFPVVLLRNITVLYGSAKRGTILR